VIIYYKFYTKLQFRIIPFKYWSEERSVDTATGYGLGGRGARSRVPVGAEDFSPLHVVQTCSEAQRISYPRGYWGFFPEGEISRGMKLTTHLSLSQRARIVELYLHSPIRLHGIVLN
jgi:hypothetical protein